MQYGLKDEHGNDTEPMSFTNSSTPEEWAKNAYETKQRAKFTNGDRGKEEMIEKLQRAASAYRKGNRPNDAYACDGYASEMSATYIAASPAKKQALLYKACQCYAAMKLIIQKHDLLSACAPGGDQITRQMLMIALVQSIDSNRNDNTRAIKLLLSPIAADDANLERTDRYLVTVVVHLRDVVVKLDVLLCAM